MPSTGLAIVPFVVLTRLITLISECTKLITDGETEAKEKQLVLGQPTSKGPKLTFQYAPNSKSTISTPFNSSQGVPPDASTPVLKREHACARTGYAAGPRAQGPRPTTPGFHPTWESTRGCEAPRRERTPAPPPASDFGLVC